MEEYRTTITADGERLKRCMDELVKTKLYVGFKAGEHTEKDGSDVATVAMQNEFGTDKIPARPFMSRTFDDHDGEIIKLVKDAVSEEEDAAGIFRIIGEGIAELMKAEIESGDYAPNSPVTIARKGSDIPLIDTGTMRDSVEYWTQKG